MRNKTPNRINSDYQHHPIQKESAKLLKSSRLMMKITNNHWLKPTTTIYDHPQATRLSQIRILQPLLLHLALLLLNHPRSRVAVSLT